MASRLNIDQITTDTPDWTSKVQIVDMSRERESPEKKIRFQNLILEDEEEQQIRAVMYGDDIGHYAEKLQISETYLISAARVRVSPTLYGKPIHKFYWVLDKETIVEHVKPTDEHEKPLPLSTKLNITTFDNIAHMTPHSSIEIDIPLLSITSMLNYICLYMYALIIFPYILLADILVFLRCGPPKYAGRNQNRC
ncbi:uncharacterized protein LOC132039314 [Lycium ferocissimum]|uniref:uncharacterized protein LOC132039314 n=1 Tax=Lycium ferocissimum TaxID=112874 RepID=UPI0028162461|nr:uncharacterized protein LOC132039314 [Lycium ferocissimum]